MTLTFLRRCTLAASGLLAFTLGGANVLSGVHQVVDTSLLVAPGVVLEVFDAGSAADRTGLKPGDVLISWKRTGPALPGRATGGSFRSPLDWRVFELEEAPRGPYVLTVEREQKRFTVSAAHGIWTGHNIDTIVRARFTGRGLEAWERGLSAVGQTYGPDPIDRMILGELRVGGEPVGKRPRPDTIAALDERLNTWRDLAADLHQAGNYATEAWLRWRMAWESINGAAPRPPVAGKPDPLPPFLEHAKQEFSRALSVLDSDSRHRGALHTLFAHEIIRTGNQNRVPKVFDEAVSLIERRQPDSLTLAEALHLFYMANARNNPAAARAAAERALAIRRSQAPESAVMALILADTSGDWYSEQDGGKASARLREAWELILRVAPFTSEAVAVAGEIGQYFEFRGDLPQIERAARHVVRTYERWRPFTRFFPMVETVLVEILVQRGKLSEAGDLAMRALKHANEHAARWSAAGRRPFSYGRGPKTVLGDVALARGDLATAERWYSEAIQSQSNSEALKGLAGVYEARGQDAQAEDLLRRFVPAGPTHNGMVPVLSRLAEIELSKNNIDAADISLQRAIDYAQKFMAGSLAHVEALRVSALAAQRRGDTATATARFAAALAAIEKQGSGTIAHADVLHAQADLLRETKNFPAAEERYRRAIDIRARLAPQTASEAASRHALAATLKAAGRLAEAEKELSAAVAALDAQMGRAGLAELSRSGVAGRSARVYADYMDFLLDAGRTDEGFQVLERSRARSFLAGLTERDVRFTADVPAALATERAQAEARYDVLQAEISRLGSTSDQAKVSRLTTEFHTQRTVLDRISARIRATSPRTAQVRYPKALSTRQIQSALDRGTVFLSYTVGAKASTLFVISGGAGSSPQPIRAIRIAAGEEELRRQIEAFRSLIAWKRKTADVTTRARSLYDLLIGPAETDIADAARIVISADGPLLSLPFAALVRPSALDRPQYLVQWKPLHHVMSASVYVEMRRPRPAASRGPVSIVAFGDPRYPSVKSTPAPTRAADDPPSGPPATAASPATDLDPEVDVETRNGTRLGPLPGSGDEVRAIGALYGTRARTFLGDAATEERARTIGRGVSVVHFAVHGITNDRLPLNSALALSIPDPADPKRANGLLQAWEIYDNIRLDADLVTLSACETAIGKEMRGEGLLGLSRAFLFAGARSVLASLWKVTDRSTSDLMVNFYTNFRRNAAKDEALRDAQLHAINSGTHAHPFYWAAFQLYGDWR